MTKEQEKLIQDEALKQWHQERQSQQAAIARGSQGGQIGGYAHIPQVYSYAPEVDSHGRVLICDEHMRLIAGLFDGLESRLNAKIDAKFANLSVNFPAEGIQAIAAAIREAANDAPAAPVDPVDPVPAPIPTSPLASDAAWSTRTYADQNDRLRKSILAMVDTISRMNRHLRWDDHVHEANPLNDMALNVKRWLCNFR